MYLKTLSIIILVAFFTKIDAQVNKNQKIYLADNQTLKLPDFFTDNMVLQCNKPIKIWGWTNTDDEIQVTIGQIVEKTYADKSGHWVVNFQPFPAGGPYLLEVNNGIEKITIKNILFGEVWFCSGQSNMGWKLRNSLNAAEELKKDENNQIRLLTVKRTMSNAPLENVETSGWQICNSKNIKDFSAVAYYFGRQLYDSLQVPIGLIHSSWGGTKIETWMSKEAIMPFSTYESLCKELDTLKIDQLIKSGKEAFDNWSVLIDSLDSGLKEKWFATNFDKTKWKNVELPGYWRDLPIKQKEGVIWYSKEINLEESDVKNDLILNLGRIDDEDITYINGELLSIGKNKDLDRKYVIPVSLVKIGKNEITVRVKNQQGYGGFRSSKEKLFLQTAARTINLCNDWKFASGTGTKLPKRPYTLHPNDYPSLLFNGMVAPFCPFAIQGVIWYQGESNTKEVNFYSSLFSNMITQWRESWNEKNMPFLFVQLANYAVPTDTSNTFAKIRDAQREVSSLKNTAMVVTIDIGESDNVHPKNKKEVGRRLSLAALNIAYKKQINYKGPEFTKLKKDKNEIIVYLNNAEGLHTKDNSKFINGFKVAGRDNISYDAMGYISKNNIRVYSDKVKDPFSVKYAFENAPEHLNLVNEAGLPAVPFSANIEN